MFVQWPIEWHCPVGHPLRPPFAGRPPSTATARSPARSSPVRPPIGRPPARSPPSACRPPARSAWSARSQLGLHGLGRLGLDVAASAGTGSHLRYACRDMRCERWAAVRTRHENARQPGCRRQRRAQGHARAAGMRSRRACAVGWAHLRVRPLKNDNRGSLSTSGPLCVDNLRACTGGTRG